MTDGIGERLGAASSAQQIMELHHRQTISLYCLPALSAGILPVLPVDGSADILTQKTGIVEIPRELLLLRFADYLPKYLQLFLRPVSLLSLFIGFPQGGKGILSFRGRAGWIYRLSGNEDCDLQENGCNCIGKDFHKRVSH